MKIRILAVNRTLVVALLAICALSGLVHAAALDEMIASVAERGKDLERALVNGDQTTAFSDANSIIDTSCYIAAAYGAELQERHHLARRPTPPEFAAMATGAKDVNGYWLALLQTAIKLSSCSPSN